MGVIITPGPSAAEGVSPPIGSVLAWLKTYDNTPALPDEFVECNGQVLDDADSVYDTQTIPDLNGETRFLIGQAISGATGGGTSINIAHTHTGPSHGHTYSDTTNTSAYQKTVQSGSGVAASNVDHSHNYSGTTNASGTGATGSALSSTQSILPICYGVVWIMRIK